MPYQQQRGRYPPRREQELPSLPKGYLDGGYFADNTNIKSELLTETAEHVARVLGNSNSITSTQLKRFFAQVRAIERELGQKGFSELVPQILSLKPMAANYVGRGSSQWERERREVFKRFIDRNVELASRDENSFNKGFIPHFESVVAYYKYHFPNK